MAAASPTSPCSPPPSRKILAALPRPPTAISPSAAFADSRTPPSSTAPTTTTPFSLRPADAIALPTSSRPKSRRSSASPPIPTALNKDVPAEPSSTSSPNLALTTCTAPPSTICATVPSAPPIPSSRLNRTTASSNSEAPSEVPSSATRFSSSRDSISTSSTFPTSSNSWMEARKLSPRLPPDRSLPATTKRPIKPWSSPQAAKLTSLAGEYPAGQIGNTAYSKLDINLTPRNQLSLRLNTTRYWGANNVFLDPASPVTYDSISNNGQEVVSTETASLSLTSGLSQHWINHFRAQFSRDRQQSYTNSSDVLVKIPTILDGMGRSNLLPRQTREHRLHLAETVSHEGSRNTWKFGGDALLTWIYDFFPSQQAANIFS